jgi:hypothetical protein
VIGFEGKQGDIEGAELHSLVDVADDFNIGGEVFDAVEVEAQAARAQFMGDARLFNEGYVVAMEGETAADVCSDGPRANGEDF